LAAGRSQVASGSCLRIRSHIPPPLGLGLHRPHGLGSPQAGKGAMGRPGRAGRTLARARARRTSSLFPMPMLTSARPPTLAWEVARTVVAQPPIAAKWFGRVLCLVVWWFVWCVCCACDLCFVLNREWTCGEVTQLVKMWCEQHVKCAWNVLGTVILAKISKSEVV